MTPEFIRWFKAISLRDIPSVGGKNASLGEMFRNLAPQGVRVPDGFAVTAQAYFLFLEENGLLPLIRARLAGVLPGHTDSLRIAGEQIRQIILAAPLPARLEREIAAAYEELAVSAGVANPDVAVRSSATAEDLPDASFAGQQETYLNIQGKAPLLDACRRCFASLFTDRAISYRQDMGYDHLRVGLSVGIQRMVRSDLACAGVIFTIDTESGFRDAVLISSAYGLGENVVQGAVNPDEFTVFKPTLAQGFRPILRKRLGSKEYQLVYDAGGGRQVRNLPVEAERRARFSLADDEVLELARWAVIVEKHYGQLHGRPTPMDLEWAKDGRTGELFIVQARPETVQSRRREDGAGQESFSLDARGKVLLEGRSVGDRIASGIVRVVRRVSELDRLEPGDILVTDRTDPDWEPWMKRAGAIVTNRGGRTCHAAIVARELGLAALVGTGTGTETLQEGAEVTVSCAEGETGYVYEGRLPFSRQVVPFTTTPPEGRHSTTRILMNVAKPDEVFRLARIPNDGVGLARIEFIIANSVRAHPLALLNFGRLKDKAAELEIARLTDGYADKTEYFVDRLAQGVGMIAAAFHPKEVIVRLSDFKSNEYASLLGGAEFEPKEENPMLGFRGASRYYDPRYRQGFALECRAMKRVRDEMGLRNVKLMVPFCRTLEEGRKVLAELETNGLKRGVDGLEIYVMCEIPSNVILAEEFADLFDGFSIGSNDLTQLILGVDRDSEIVSHVFDERNPAVKRMISSVIRAARAKGRKIGICGQAPSDYPEFARFLVEEGIDSISLNPDSVLKARLALAGKAVG